MNSLKRKVVIITDSLGMPRENISLEDTWVFKLLLFHSQYYHFVPIANRGMSASIALEYAIEVANYYKPDLVILQFGIVDAARRSLPSFLRMIAKKIKLTRTLLKKYHFSLTRINENHTTNLHDFEKIVYRISKDILRGIPHAFIEIAGPGYYMLNQCYGILDDIRKYNEVFYSIENNKCSIIRYPKDIYFDNILIKEDGHHLNPTGAEIVFEMASKYIISNNIL